MALEFWLNVCVATLMNEQALGLIQVADYFAQAMQSFKNKPNLNSFPTFKGLDISPKSPSFWFFLRKWGDMAVLQHQLTLGISCSLYTWHHRARVKKSLGLVINNLIFNQPSEQVLTEAQRDVVICPRSQASKQWSQYLIPEGLDPKSNSNHYRYACFHLDTWWP